MPEEIIANKPKAGMGPNKRNTKEMKSLEKDTDCVDTWACPGYLESKIPVYVNADFALESAGCRRMDNQSPRCRAKSLPASGATKGSIVGIVVCERTVSVGVESEE